MFKIEKILLLSVVAAVLLTFVGGCAKKNKNQKKYLLRWSDYAFPVYDKFRAEESKKFEGLHPEAEVRYEPIPGDFRSKILTQIAGNTAPDIFIIEDMQEFIGKDALVDITGYVKKDAEVFKNIRPELMNALEFEGKYYALPGNCVVDVLYYNKDLFDKEKLSYPNENWTWEDMLKAAQKLTKRGPDGRIEQFGIAIDPSSLLLLISQNGGKVWNEKKDRCIINSPETIQAMQFFQDLSQKYKVAPTISYIQQHGTSENFVMERAAMYLGGSWEISVFKIRNKSGKALSWDATLPPHSAGKPKYTFLSYQSLGVWTGSKNPELAYELIKFMADSKRTRFLVEVGDSLPMHKKGEDVDYYLKDPNRPENAKKEMLKALTYAHSRYREHLSPLVPYAQQGKILGDGFDKLVNCLATPQQIAKEIESKLNEILLQNTPR